jgi:hypothetical protein
MAPGPEHANASPGDASTAVAASREYERRKLRGGIRPMVHRSPPSNEGARVMQRWWQNAFASRCSRTAHPRADTPPRASARSTCGQGDGAAVGHCGRSFRTGVGVVVEPAKERVACGCRGIRNTRHPERGAAQGAQAMPTVGPALTLLFTFMTSFLSRVPNGPGCRWLVQASPIMSVVAVQVHRPDERDLDRHRRSYFELLALRHPPGRLSW